VDFRFIQMDAGPLANGVVRIFIFRLLSQHHFEAALHRIGVV
jgi:hypothetical protein